MNVFLHLQQFHKMPKVFDAPESRFQTVYIRYIRITLKAKNHRNQIIDPSMVICLML